MLGFEGATISKCLYGLVGKETLYVNKCEPQFSADPEQKRVKFGGTQRKMWSILPGR